MEPIFGRVRASQMWMAMAVRVVLNVVGSWKKLSIDG